MTNGSFSVRVMAAGGELKPGLTQQNKSSLRVYKDEQTLTAAESSHNFQNLIVTEHSRSKGILNAEAINGFYNYIFKI